MVAFAAQDNSAAIQSPPILVPTNVPNRRRRRREKNEIKRKDVNKTGATEACIEEQIFATDTSNEKRVDYPSSPIKYGIIGLSPDVVPKEDKHISREQNQISKSKECKETPQPPFQRIQERLKPSQEEVHTSY